MSSLPLPVRFSFSSDSFSTTAKKPPMLAMSGWAVFAVETELLGFSVILSVVLRACFSVV